MNTEAIPKKAKLVFKGKIFDVYQWEQKMFDGSTKTFELLKRPNNVQVVAVVGDKILIEEQEQPGKGTFVSLPGGRVDAGESELDAAKRELLEETGYESTDWTLWKQFQPSIKIVFEVFIYVARGSKKVAEQRLDSGEKIVTKLVVLEELMNLTDNGFVFRQWELALWLMEMRLNSKKKGEFSKLLWP